MGTTLEVAYCSGQAKIREQRGHNSRAMGGLGKVDAPPSGQRLGTSHEGSAMGQTQEGAEKSGSWGSKVYHQVMKDAPDPESIPTQAAQAAEISQDSGKILKTW